MPPFDIFEDAVRSTFKIPGVGPLATAVAEPPKTDDFASFENAVRSLPFASPPINSAQTPVAPEFAAFNKSARDAIQSLRRASIERGEQEATAAYDSSRDVFAAGRPLLEAPQRAWNAVKGADLVGGYVQDWQDEAVPLWARALRGTFGVPAGAWNKLITSGIGIRPEADAAVVAEDVARGPGGPLFGGPPGAVYDFGFSLGSDPLMLASAPESAMHRLGKQMTRAGIETGAHVAPEGARVVDALKNYRFGPQTSFLDMLRGKHIPDDFAERVLAPEILRQEISDAAVQAGVPLAPFKGAGVREALDLGPFDATKSVLAPGPIGGPIPESVAALRDTLEAVRTQHPEYLAAKQKYMKMPYESAEQLIPQAFRQSRFGKAIGFQEHLSDIGKSGRAPAALMKQVEPLWNPAMSTGDRAAAYALREAQTLKGLTEGAPMLRFAGIKTPIPSPIPVMASTVGRAFANWVDVGKDLRAPLAEKNVAGRTGGVAYVQGRQWTDAAGNPADWSGAPLPAYGGGTAEDLGAALVGPDFTPGPHQTVANLERHIRGLQEGANGVVNGMDVYANPDVQMRIGQILTASSRAPGLASAAKNVFEGWLQRDLKSFSQADRPARFDMWRAAYQLLYDVKVANPAVKMSVDVKALKETLDHMDRLSGGDAVKAEAFWQDLYTADVGLKPVQQFRNELFTRIQQFTERSAQTLDEPVAAITADNAVPTVMRQIDLMSRRAETFFESEEGQKELFGMFGALNEWLQSMVPTEVAQANFNAVFQAGDLAGRRSAESARLQSVFEDMLGAPQLKRPVSGLELTAKLISGEKKNPVSRAVNGLLSAQKVKGVSNLDLSAITPTQIADQRTAFETAITAGETSGRLTPVEAADLRSFLNEVEAGGPESWGAYMRVMKDTTDFKNIEMAVAAISKKIFEPLKEMHAKADAMGRKLSMKTMADLQRQLSTEQVLYTPHGPGKLKWVQSVIEKTEATKNQIMRFAGIPPALARVVRENDDTMLYADRHAEEWSRIFRREQVEQSWRDIANKYRTPGTPAVMAPVNRATLLKLNEGFMKKAGNEGWERFQHFDPDVVTEVQRIAKMRVDEGDDALKEVFGTQAIVDDWYANMWERLNTENALMFQIEREAGMVDVRRMNYVPHLLMGSYSDQDRFWKWMAGKELDEVSRGARPIVSETFAPGLTRDRMTMAEIEYELKRFAESELGSQPVNLQAAYHLTGAMAHRRLMHQRALATRKFVTELQQALPGHLLPLGLSPKGKGWAGDFQKAGFRNLGKLIPSLRDWWAQPLVYDFLGSRVARNATMLDFEGAAFGPWRWLREMQRSFKWLNTTFDIYHTKNILGLAHVSDTSLGRAASIIQRAIKNRGKNVGSVKEQALSPLEAVVEGLEQDPMYQLGLRNGISPFRGHEYQVPLVDRVLAEERPVLGARGAAGAVFKDFRLRGGPGSKMTFDILDQAVKQSKFEELLEQGIPAHHAADMANYHLIDYSLRWMHPNVRNWAYTIFPFFAWKIGNWALHPAQFLQRPGRYMLYNHLREAATNFFVGGVNSEYYDALTEMAAGGMIIPMEDPQTGNQMVLDWAMPWDSIFAPFRKLAQESPAEWPLEFMRYFAGNIWDFPYKWFVQSDNQRRYQLSEGGARQGWADWSKEALIGTPEREGWLNSLTWGIAPWKDLGGLMVDPSKWDNWDFYTKKFLMDSFANTTQMTPSTATGKPRRAPLSR